MFSGFLLGPYHVYPKHDKIIYQAKVFKLEPKIMQVLCFLASNPGIVFSREEITEALWPGTFVGGEVITRAIFELRKILLENAKEPKYIETITRKGYCFIGSIQKLSEEKETSLVEEKPSVNKCWSWLLPTIVATVLCFFVLWLTFISTTGFRANVAEKELSQRDYQATILSDGRENIQSAAISPDRLNIVYIETNNINSRTSVVLKDIKNHQHKKLIEGNASYRSVIWADNVKGYFIKCLTQTCEIHQFSIKSNQSEVVYTTKQQLKSITLSPQGNEILFSWMKKKRLKISILSTKNLTHQPLSLNDKASNYNPSYDKSSGDIYYVEHKNAQSIIKKYNVVTKESESISSKFSKITSLFTLAENTLVIGGQVNGHYAIWQLNIMTNAMSQLTSVPASSHAYHIDISNDLQQIFYLRKSTNIDIKIKGLPKNVSPELINSHANDLNALWSKSDNSIYFVSQRTGSYEVWRYSDNKNIKLTNISADIIERPILNHAQTKLAFLAVTDNQLQLFIYNIKEEKVVFSQKVNQRGYLLSWSKNRNVVYMSIASENIYDIWEFSLTNNNSQRVILGGGLLAQEYDENNLYFGDLGRQSLMTTSHIGEISMVKSFKGIPLVVRPHNMKIITETKQLLYIEKDKKELNVISADISKANMPSNNIFSLKNNNYVTDMGVNRITNKNYPYVIYDHINSKTSQLVFLNAVD
jgi:DNA-binding winged helix-turn-helix (wHTH) protein/Tol biopolymer transport system component